MPVDKLKQQLQQLEIDYIQYNHPPLYTCEDADKYFINRKGLRLKNLFLRDNPGKRHFLLLTAHDVQVDLKQLSKNLGISRIGFASEQQLDKYLQVKSGCVSLLALYHDNNNQVEFWIDKDIWHHELFLAHPFINTETLALAKADINKFIAFTGHDIQLVDVPKKV